MPMPDPQYQRIHHAYTLNKCRIIDLQGEYRLWQDVIVLVQKGPHNVTTAGIATVDNQGQPSWQPASRLYGGFPEARNVLEPNTKIPDAFRSGINTVFPDYDVNDGRCWVTNGNKILAYDFKKATLTRKEKPIKDMFSGVPTQFQDGWDAALTCHKKKVWLFKGNKYAPLEGEGTSLLDEEGSARIEFGDPQEISTQWTHNDQPVPLIANGIDAAVRVPHTNTGYLFRGDKYVKVDTEKGKVIESERLIRTYFHGVPSLYPTPDAIMRLDDLRMLYVWGKYCFNLSSHESVPSFDPTWPKPKLISEVFPQVEGTDFEHGIHRILQGRTIKERTGQYAGPTYLFRKDKYMTVTGQSGQIGGSLKAQDIVPAQYSKWADQVTRLVYRKNYKKLYKWIPGKGANTEQSANNNLDNLLKELGDKHPEFLNNLQGITPCTIGYTDSGLLFMSSEPRVAIGPYIQNIGQKLTGPFVFNWELPWPTE